VAVVNPFRACEGCPYGGRVAGTRGPENARVCVVGEAPGANELRDGIPFIGEAGQLLAKSLARIGVDHEQVFITNALRCRPPVGKPPGPGPINACKPRLLEEVTRHPRDLVLALGNTALRSLTGNLTAKITQERGRLRDVTLNGTVPTTIIKVAPTYHPALILRSPGEMPKFMEDLKYFFKVLEGQGPVKDPGAVTFTVPKWEEIPDAVDYLLGFETLACDIETSGFNPRSNDILCIGVAGEKNKVVIFEDAVLHHPDFVRLYSDPGPRWVYWNGKFDAAYIRQLLNSIEQTRVDAGAPKPTIVASYLRQSSGLLKMVTEKRIHTLYEGDGGISPVRVDEDGMLIHYMLSEGNREPHGLKDVAADLLGADPDYDKVVKSYAPKMTDSFASVPRDILYLYAAKDVDHTFQAYQILKPRLMKRGRMHWAYENILIPASAMLQDVERYGVWVHKPTVAKLSKELEEELGKRQAILRKVAEDGLWDPKDYAKWKGPSAKVPKEFNPGSSYQLLYIFEQLGITPRDPRTRKVSSNEPALKELPSSPFVDALRAARKAAKMLSTYVDGVWNVIDPGDGRVHSTYLLHGTATGRLSSRNPNMQNIPRDARIRDMFQAPPGRLLVELDYRQVELRVLAYLSGDPGLRRIYDEGRDLHDEVSKQLFPGWESYKDTVLGKEQRVRAKFVNFGIAYGRGAESLAAEFKMGRPEAKHMIDRWWAAFPQAQRFVQKMRGNSRSGVPIETPFGRRRRFSLITTSNQNALENEAINFPIQSTASDLTLLSAIDLHPRLIPLDAHIINLVHDSILIECDPGSADQVVALARQIMLDTPAYYLSTDFPFEVSHAVAASWGQLK